MTDKMKKFLEEISGDEQYLGKLTDAETPEALIALAAEKGFALTEEDLTQDASSGELSDDDLDGVAGGMFLPILQKLIAFGRRKTKAGDVIFRGVKNDPQRASTLEYHSDETKQLNDLVHHSFGQNDDTGIVSL